MIEPAVGRDAAGPDYRAHPREFLEHLYRVAVACALPLQNTARYLPTPPKGRTVVLGAGKAGGAMAHAVEGLWPTHAALSGLVVTRYGHVPRRPVAQSPRVEVVEAAHPVPDAAGVEVARRMLALAQGLSADDLVLCLISGGGSALLSLPAPGLSLQDKQRIHQELLDSGATISEMNCVRKHLSAIKGGRLAQACFPARVVTLCISDVPGDDPSIIASGPTLGDATTCAQALSILERYRLSVPASVVDLLRNGKLETPKPGDATFDGHEVHLIATPGQSLAAAAQAARAAGLCAYVLSDEMEGESRELGRFHAALARSIASSGQPFAPSCVLLSGGETTVSLRPSVPGGPRGKGGRAGEFCLGLAQALRGQERVYALAADTDGIDGVEDNAGAWVLPDTLGRALGRGMNIDAYLQRNDAYSYFAALGDLLRTGPTFTNVNDFRAVLVL